MYIRIYIIDIYRYIDRPPSKKKARREAIYIERVREQKRERERERVRANERERGVTCTDRHQIGAPQKKERKRKRRKREREALPARTPDRPLSWGGESSQ